MSERAVFLDRDGVIIENRAAYVRSWEDVALLPGAVEALCLLGRLPYRVILVTNQSAVGRGLMTAESLDSINRRLLATLARRGARIDDIFTCPHAPHEGCSCRKPLPGLLLEAATKHGLDLPGSTLIGDAVSDLQAGLAAGLRQVALVRTGRGRSQEALLARTGLDGADVFDDLLAAVEGLFPESPGV